MAGRFFESGKQETDGIDAPRSVAPPAEGGPDGLVAPDGTSQSTVPRTGRVALLIGNSAYPGGRLRNPANDVRLLAGTLRALGFETEELYDVAKAGLEHALVAFGARVAEAKGEAISIFYFAGHGVQHQGQNYLIPVDARIPDARFLKSGAIRVDFLLEELASSTTRANLVMLDACRNNPIPVVHRGPEELRGLAAIEKVPDATVIVYSTAAGSIAGDGDGDNSPYALALSRAFERAGARLRDVIFDAADLVASMTGGAQRPALFVQGALPDVEIARPAAKPASPPKKGPWGSLPETDCSAPAETGQYSAALPDPELTIEKPTPPGLLRYGLSAIDWEQGFPGDLVNEVIDTGRWPQVESAFARGEPYAATLVAIRNMVAHRPDWGSPDHRLALRAASTGARAGIRQAFMVVGWLYAVGAGGLSRDTGTEYRILAAMANRGYRFAELQLGIRLAIGVDAPAAPGEAIGWLEKAAEKGATNALHEIGCLYTDLVKAPYRIDFEKARHYFERAVAAGSIRSASALAGLYVDGKLQPRDQSEVSRLLDMAAAAGDALSLFRRGLRAEHGEGVARDMKRSMADYRAAAEAGSTDAMLALCHHLTYGNDCTAQDPAEAAVWAGTARDRRSVAAHAILGRFYETGFGVPVNSEVASGCYRAAIAAGDLDGHLGLARLHARSALGPRDETELRTHATAALRSNRQSTRDEAEELLARLETEAKLAAVSATVKLEAISIGSDAAPVGLVVFHAIEDPDCATAFRDVLAPIIRFYTAAGHVKITLHEGDQRAGAGVSAVVRSMDALQRGRVIERLYETRDQWVDAPNLAPALARILHEFGVDERHIARSLTSWDLTSRILYLAGQISRDLGVRRLPTVFANGRRLVQPTLCELEEAILLALPPETATRLAQSKLAGSVDGPE